MTTFDPQLARSGGPDYAREMNLAASGTSAVVTFPTGAGKTWLSLQAARATLSAGGRVMVVVPMRALATEIAAEWRAALPGVQVQAYTGDTRGASAYRESRVQVLTPERLDLITRRWRTHLPWLSEVQLAVVDEAHHLGDASRGARLDAGLTRLRMILPLLRVLALTATCGNPDEIASWLSGVHFGGGSRPVPLTWEIHEVKDPRAKRQALLEKVRGGPQTLVFCRARAAATTEANLLRAAGVHAEAHHAGLVTEERARIEADFRSGEIQVLLSTGTLELGVNLPAQAVILHDLTVMTGRPGETSKPGPITVNTAWQRAGRAGRDPRKQEAGMVTLLTLPHEHHARALEDGNFEPIRSPLGGSRQRLDFILGSLDGGLARTETQLARLAGRTLAAWQGQLDTQGVSAELIREEALIRLEDGTLEVTPLGRVASGAMLLPSTVRARRRLIQDPTAYDVLLRACGTHDALQLSLPPSEDTMYSTEGAFQRVPSRVLDTDAVMFRHQPASATALAALRACEVGDVEAAAELGLFPPQLTALRENLTRILAAWESWMPTKSTGELRVQLVRVMLTQALPLDAATLALLPGVGAKFARTLASRGFDHLETLAQTTPEELAGPGLSQKRAAAMIAAAETLIARWDTDPAREPPAGNRSEWPLALLQDIDPLRLFRAANLKVDLVGQTYRVTGGTSPHEVHLENGVLRCDCLDARPGRACKHVMAVRLHQGDEPLTQMLTRLQP